MRNTKYIRLAGIVMCLGLGVLVAWYLWLAFMFASHIQHEKQEKRSMIFEFASNRGVELRAAARTLVENLGGESDYVPLDAIPRTIRELNCSSVTVKDGNVELEFGGGFYHQGLVVFPEGSVTPKNNELRRIATGIFYYEEE